jgi:thioredoxin 1
VSHSIFRILSLTAAALAASAVPALAAPIQKFSTAALQAAQRAGRPVLVDVHADWCPTCRAQAPTIDAISRDPVFNKLIILKLDFDAQVAERTALGVRKQSTLIAYNGRNERARSLGITDPAQIKALAAQALR